MKSYSIKFSAVIFILLFSIPVSFAQIPDDINGRFWRLSKVWGFAKYYHPNNCNANWNDLLLDAIDSIVISTSNNAFNKTILEMLDKAGSVPHSSEPFINPADINVNADFAWKEDSLFSPEVRNLLDSILINFRPKDNCLVKTNQGIGYLSFNSDSILNIPDFSYSQAPHRLLVLFYYWNIINYFHADKYLMDQDWDSTLFQFIPIIRESKNEIEFHLNFLNLVTYINDSHGFTFSPLISNYFGTFYPSLKIQFLEHQTVITGTGPEINGISVGDIIKKINGLDVTFLRDSLAQFIPASNEHTLNRDLDDFILRGAFDSIINIELEDSKGGMYTQSIKRSLSAQAYYDWKNTDTKPMIAVLECGYGYVNMGKLTSFLIPQMYSALKNTPAIIFDVRNYPNGTIFDLIPYLYSDPQTWALLTEPDPNYTGWYDWYDNILDAGSFSNSDPYDGKVIILVNAETQSHAEYTVMALQKHPNAYTIGSQTAGADGNISLVFLPGSLGTYWTTLGIFYPDSTTAQRVGVRIDSVVTPTIEGIRRGKDEVLASAFDCLTSSSTDPKDIPNFTLYPNPADDLIYLSFEYEMFEKVEIDAINVLGQQVYSQGLHPYVINEIPIDVTQWANGFYVITLKNKNGIFAIAKILVQH